MTLKTIIIDDEELARQRLRRLLTVYDEIDVMAEAENGLEALDLISSLKPDFIFLDIEMPVLNGFEMLAKLTVQPKVIFTTAYDHYAIKAFEEDSLDYLLKPVEADRLEKTIRKLHNHHKHVQHIPIDTLLRQLKPETAMKTLTVKIGDKILLIKLLEVIFIEAEDKYVFIHTSDGKKHLTDYTITALEGKLPDDFFRISRSVIINCNSIKEIRKGFNGSRYFIMNNTNESRLSSGRSFTDGIKERFDI